MGLPTFSKSTAWNAWWFLLWFSMQRHWRLRQMVSVAVGLALVVIGMTLLITRTVGWDRTEWRLNRATPIVPYSAVVGSPAWAMFEGQRPLVDEMWRKSAEAQKVRAEGQPFAVFSRWIVFFLFLGFLMPLWTLAFASTAIGGERETRTLLWLNTRPIPKESIYLAKLLALLPWTLVINLGGFALLCAAGGTVGQEAFFAYWPGIAAGTVAFSAIFHLFGAMFSRPAIVCMLYAFFFETLLSELPVPGTLKRFSINYYIRCLLYPSAEANGYTAESTELFVPVSPLTAWGTLLLASAVLTWIGMRWYAQAEYREEV